MFPIAVKQGEDKLFRINNLSLNLTNAAIADVNVFKNDPLGQIKKLDPATYDLITAKPDQ